VLPLSHYPFYLIYATGNARRQVLAAAFGYKAVVLKAETNAPFLVVNPHVVQDHVAVCGFACVSVIVNAEVGAPWINRTSDCSSIPVK